MITKSDIFDFFNKHKFAVISTADDSRQPESALIGFGETNKLEIIFGTYRTTRKYKNIQKNNAISLVIGWNDDNITIQYEGYAFELKQPDLDKYVSLYHQKVPEAVSYRSHPEQTYFKITPKWIRYSDLSGDKEKIFEFTFK